jgi:hypothetical protein
LVTPTSLQLIIMRLADIYVSVRINCSKVLPTIVQSFCGAAVGALFLSGLHFLSAIGTFKTSFFVSDWL